jgi:hypothetical protein
MRPPSPPSSFLFVLSIGISGCTAGGGTPTNEAPEEAELAVHTGTLQHWTHKTTLALDTRNPALADFYLHELGEIIEAIQEEVLTYEGHPVTELTDRLLVPRMEALDEALCERAWPTVDERVNGLA